MKFALSGCLGLTLLALICARPGMADDATGAGAVRVSVLDKSGELAPPANTPKVVHTDAEWHKKLSRKAFHVAREKGTEAAGSGTLLRNKKHGIYTCAGCDLPLFSSDSKFESGTGWPSFFQPVAKENVTEHNDQSYGMLRVEVVCTRCESHLGHVFNDGPQPTGLRYCMNSVSLGFTPDKHGTGKNGAEKHAEEAKEADSN